MCFRILVADDDPLMRTFVAVSLAQLAETVDATDGNETLDLLRERHFDLVLLDWDMPCHSGLEILKTLREQGCHTPIIMVTAKNERGNVLQAIHIGASDYVIKPFDTDVLREKVAKLLNKKGEEPSESQWSQRANLF